MPARYPLKAALLILPAAFLVLHVLHIVHVGQASWEFRQGQGSRSTYSREDYRRQSTRQGPNQLCSTDASRISVVSSTWTGRDWSEPWNAGLDSSTSVPPRATNTPLLAFVHNSVVETAVMGEQAHIMRLLEYVYGWRRFSPRAASGDEKAQWSSAAVAQELTHDMDGTPDVLLFMEQEDILAAAAGNTHLAGVQLWLYVDDPHWHASSEGESRMARDRRQAALSKAHKLLALKAPQMPKYYPQLDASRILWLSHGAGPEYILPLNPEPIPTILLAGATYPTWYPVRSAISERVRARDPRFVQFQHPGYYSGDFYTRSGPFRSVANTALARAFHSALACITDGLVLRHVLAKVYEITATGCLLLLDAGIAEQVAWQGFLPGVHYISYSLATLDAVADAVLEPGNRGKVDTIRAQGQALTLTRHLYTHKAAMIHETAVQSSRPAYPFPNVTHYDGVDLVQQLARIGGG